MINQLWNECFYQLQHINNKNVNNNPPQIPTDNANLSPPSENHQPEKTSTNNKTKNNSLITKYFKSLNAIETNNSNNTPSNTPNTTTKNNSSNNKIYFSIPYHNNNTLRLKHYLMSNIPENHTITMKPTNKLIDLIYTNTKDKIDKQNNTNIIYQIPCNECDLSYIGQTKQF